jgi:hypothetical protein
MLLAMLCKCHARNDVQLLVSLSAGRLDLATFRPFDVSQRVDLLEDTMSAVHFTATVVHLGSGCCRRHLLLPAVLQPASPVGSGVTRGSIGLGLGRNLQAAFLADMNRTAARVCRRFRSVRYGIRNPGVWPTGRRLDRIDSGKLMQLCVGV